MGLINALKNGQGEYTGQKAKNVNITLGNGDANISVRGDNVNIEAGTGNQTVVVLGNDVDVELDKNASLDWDSTKDKDTVAVVSDNKTSTVSINTGDGNDIALALGKNVNIEMGDGDHVASFWGENVNVNVGNGSNNITTMDKFIIDGNLDENTSVLGINIGKAFEDAIEADTIKKTEVLYDLTTSSYTKEDFLAKIKNTYQLDNVNMKVLEDLYDSGELMKELQPGVPLYSVMESVKQKNPDGSTKYIICKNDWTIGNEGIHSRGLIAGSSSIGGVFNVNGQSYGFSECVASSQYEKSSFTESNQVIREVATRDYWDISGPKNVNVNTGNGTNNYINLTSTNEVNINSGDFKNHSINIDSGRIYNDIEINRTVTNQLGRTINFGTNIANTYTSPIVVDFNKDGKVSAASGNGVDVDGNGIGDGYASNGDKMLAMSDKNANGAIDGSEVFGDQTVSPFSGQKLNAANGFEALRMVAEEAEQYTGIKCVFNGEVDLQLLKSALSTVGVDLGFISDNNVSKLEGLAHVASINVAGYNEVDAEGNVQHRQQGTYTDADGNTYGANDVWFKNRTNIDNMLDRLK